MRYMTDYCLDQVRYGHETFECLEAAGHLGPHKSSLVPPACSACGGLEEHTGTCPRMEETDSRITHEVQWDDSSMVTLVEWTLDRKKSWNVAT